MIIVIQGAPGSGKSYEATVFHALPALRRGRRVITNLPLNVEKFSEIDPEFASLIELRTESDVNTPIFSQIEHYDTDWTGTDPDSKKEMGPIFIIDECHRSIGPGMPSEEVKDWFAMHRHKGFDIVLITQDSSDIDRSVINRVDHSISVENLKRKGLNKSYMRRVFSNAGWRTHLEAETLRHFKSKYFALYTSYTQGGSGLELGSSDGQTLLQQPFLWFCGVILILAVGGAVFGVNNLLNRDGNSFLFPGPEPEASPGEKTKKADPSSKHASATKDPDTALLVKPPKYTLAGLRSLGVAKYSGVISSDNGNMFLFQFPNVGVVSYSAIELKKAGYTIVGVYTCRLIIRNNLETTVISC